MFPMTTAAIPPMHSTAIAVVDRIEHTAPRVEVINDIEWTWHADGSATVRPLSPAGWEHWRLTEEVVAMMPYVRWQWGRIAVDWMMTWMEQTATALKGEAPPEWTTDDHAFLRHLVAAMPEPIKASVREWRQRRPPWDGDA